MVTTQLNSARINTNELVDDDGDVVIFEVNPRFWNAALYYFIEDARGWLHCHAMFRDTKGRFWVWSYRPVGKGARSGKARDFVINKPRWYRRRKSAMREATRRNNKRPAQTALPNC